jgi:DNA ligase 1
MDPSRFPSQPFLVRFAELVSTSDAVSGTRSRKKKAELLSRLLRRATPEELPVVVLYLCGIVPQGKIGVGWAALAKARDVPPSTAPELEVLEVHHALSEIASPSGAGSGTARQQALGRLFSRATAEERDLLGGILLGEIRQGGLEGIMIESLALAFGIDAGAIRGAYMLAGDLGRVADALVREGATGLARFALVPFHPVHPMLAQPSDDVEEAIAELGECSLDWKLDGARVQVHRVGDDVRIFTRNLADVTPSLPEVVEIARGLPGGALILDGEAIALRPDGSPRPFQATMSRFSTKVDVDAARRGTELSVFFFDCLLAETSLLAMPLRERLAVLDAVVPEANRMPRIVTDDPVVARTFYEDTLRRGHEGAVLKALASPYEAGARGGSWRKLKRAHTLDLAILAAEWGHGRRQGFLSNVHLGARTPDGFVMLGKTFKGMTDAMLAFQTEKLQELAIRSEGHVVHVRPELVAEVAFQDVQASPRYPAGMALRLARIVRYRPDKGPGDVSSLDEVRAVFDLSRDRPEEG